MAVTLDTIQTEIDAIQDNLARQTTKLNNHLSDVDADINTINTKMRLLDTQDERLHQGIHDIAQQLDSNKTRLDRLENKDFQGQLDGINKSMDQDIQKKIVDMDLEHHLELHLLANGIDANTSRLEKLELKGASIPEHVIISEEEYETLSPEFGKFYFTYED